MITANFTKDATANSWDGNGQLGGPGRSTLHR